MIATLFGSAVTYLAGSLLSKLAIILAALVLIVWLARKLRRGSTPADSNAAGALILLIALAGATAGFGYSAIDRASERIKHTNALARVEADKATLAERLNDAMAEAEALRVQAERTRRMADAAAARAADSDRRVVAAQRERSALAKQLTRRARDASQNADGSVPVVGPEWLRIYNAALGFDLPAPAADPGLTGRAADPAGTAVAGESKPGGPQPAEAGLLAPQVTTADVLENHITNADAARDSAERLTELQRWYNQLRDERNNP